jgi:mannose-6-phosphate isomerase-like protein (cupin superfamily)
MKTDDNSIYIRKLQERYPGKKVYDLDGSGAHFVCEVEPAGEHPEYDRAVEIIFRSKPHKHLKTAQRYKILSGKLALHVGDSVIDLNEGDEHVIAPNQTHWAESEDGSWVEIYSTPGWIKEDHITV